VHCFQKHVDRPGSGEDDCKAIWADWGNKDLQDDMAMVDYAHSAGDRRIRTNFGVGRLVLGEFHRFILGQTQRFHGGISGAG